ncbi:PQQ-binding-like beta-propeller repeat protein [Pontiella agarivorans]|uniref:PQQ-binding-like beta-propeller repeat protein n=1 Tax=Pontiella agarivorans TaxID=3038953 RepID=A0ABU5MUD0_9BACT|nr:PQQ-binding-like beta-propeller repeat protein [Pontiella agarivorans]MDZ8117822.1 PQQ-binding-like beta-propeller repeat protein [Pontiella agarivorans]
MKSILLLMLALMGSVAAGKKAISSFDTGFTMMKVRAATARSTSFIVSASYEGTVAAYTYDGTELWTNPLSGFMVHDMWCADLTGNGIDEIMVANADGSLYCLNHRGVVQWTFRRNDAPMYAVCVVHAETGRPYVVCGGYDLNIYYLTAKGKLRKTIHSRTYGKEKAYGNMEGHLPPDGMHIANFLRPVTVDGVEKLAVHGVMNNMQMPGYVYLFDVLEDLPNLSHKCRTVVGDFRALDPDGDGTDEIIMGSTLNRDAGRAVRYDIETDKDTVLDIYRTRKLNAKCGAGYRVTQTELLEDGSGETQYAIFYGSNILIAPADLDADRTELLSNRHAYYDMCKDTDGRFILASAQSGGSCIHIIDPRQSSWKSEYEELTPPGKIEAILANTATARRQLANFEKPEYERDPLPVYFLTEGTRGLEGLVESLTNKYAHMIFLNSVQCNAELRDWRTEIDNEYYRNKRHRHKQYTLTSQEVVDTLLSAYDESPGIQFWGGHGNDPYFYNPETLKKVIDGAGGKKTVITWPEMGDHSENLSYLVDHLFEPVATHAQGKNVNVFLRNKNIYWQGNVYQYAWKKLLSGAYAGVVVPSMEETSDKTMDLSIAGRLGLWASGVVDQWGTRCAMDNPSFDRLRQFSTQRLPNHFLRMLVYHLSSGAQFLNNHPVDQEYLSIYWELVAQGALYIPERDEIVSFSPVHLSMIEPDTDYMNQAADVKWTTFWDEHIEKGEPMVFNRMNGSWPAAPVVAWDFSRYAAGTKERRQNFLPSYSNGMVLITPPQEGVFADQHASRGRMEDHLHPLYRNIMKEYITDGKKYYSADGTKTYAADQYYKRVEADIKAAAKKLPLTVSGDAAWVCAQTSPSHLRLTLIDGGYLNPSDKEVTIQFNTVRPRKITDLLEKSRIPVNHSSATVTIPCGLFRFLDIELETPFYDEQGELCYH